ncbi:MAG TPA: hypothetical protein VFQ23_11565 [Anaerolineales bacterium]|nr:hypothetical protein [Anaerolineales bacterium]
MTLYQVTFTVNFVALIASLWLGMYLVTRNPRVPTAWLTALTLWSLGGLFFNVLLALNPPPDPTFRPAGLRFLFPFWPSGEVEDKATAWLQGWSVIPSIAFWHHATLLMRPGKMNPWRWTRVVFTYIVAIAAIAVQTFTQILFSVEGGDPLYLNSLRAGPLYSVFGVALIALTIMSIINLARSAYVAPTEIVRRQLLTLVGATVFTGLIGPVSLVSSGLDLFPMPMVVMSGVLAVFVAMIGYGVARYSALVEKRTIDRDFFYNLIGVIVMVSIYTLAAWVLVFAYQAPRVIVIVFPLLGVLTHTGLNAASIFLDWFFYRGETRRLRFNLHSLRRLAGESENMKILLEQILGALCVPIKATYALVLTFEDATARQVADFRWKNPRLELPSGMLTADDVLHLTPKQFPAPLEDAALLIPLYIESEQIGALVLGRPTNGLRYAHADLERLLYPSDQIAEALFLSRQNTERLEKVALLADAQPAPPAREFNIPVNVVENALRNLFDYAYLADTPMAEMELVRARLAAGKKTHLERGKTVQAVLLEALEHMRPSSEVPRDPPPREWYPYVIIHDAYVNGKQNRDVMSRLYISEGTFNRTRRAAITSLARALVEMEHPS